MPHFVTRAPVYVTAEGLEPNRPPDAVQWIAIKRKLSTGDRNQVLDLVEMHIGGSAQGGDKLALASASLKAGQMLSALMHLAIVDWHIHDEEGHDVPFTAEAVDELDGDDPLVDRMLGEVAALNPTPARLR
jgi:hypothetical protein